MLWFLEEKKGLAIGGAIACLVVAGAIKWSQRERDIFPPETGFFCVVTGDVFWIDPMKTTTCPMPNPKTGERTLLPYERKEDGKLYIRERYTRLVNYLKEVNKYVDPETFECRRP